MLALGPFAFAAPWLLVGLASLPILWWLLRVTPPAPRRVRFPALRLLLGLVPREETPAKTPLWLILLRMALAALIILALAHPLLNPRARFAGSGPLVLAVDNGWSAARHWDERRTMLDSLVAQADREGRNVVLLPTAPLPGAAAPPPLSVLRPADAHAAVTELAPMPWPEDRQAALARLEKLDLGGAADLVWLSDGIDDGEAASFAQGLGRLGPLRVLADSSPELPRLLAAGNSDDKDLAVVIRRADATAPIELYLRVLGDDGRLLARQQVTLPAGALRKEARLQMPSELRNRATQIQIEGEASAGAVLLLDERWRRRPVGVLVPHSSGPAQPLLSGTYYVEKALTPFSEVREGDIATLLKGEIAVLVLPDLSPNGPAEAAALDKWINAGGTVLRFAGPHLAEETGNDTLLPVTLRKGGRTLGGALSWEKPARLAPFDASSPFAGLAIPEDVTISRQVLAEPTLDLGNKTWARLTDGTPLVTAEKRGKGWLVLVHTTADPEWSNLGISGLFVDMLRRIVALSQGVTGNSDKPLPPVETLDGYGRLQRASATAATIQAGGFAKTIASAKFPPGFYGTEDARQALNLAPAVTRFASLPELPPGVEHGSYARGPEIDFRPSLLTAALALGLIDLLVAYALRGLFSGLSRLKRGAASGAGALLFLLLMHPAQAQTSDDFAIKATSGFHLAYVQTGVPDADAESQAGLVGLSNILRQRTAVDAGAPMAVDIEHDELIFFPLLYWPVVPGEAPPSPQAVERINKYLATGGTILFDTQDQGESTPLTANATQDRLRQIAAGLEIPALIPLPPDHVLTKSFYLLQEFPGRWAGGTVWVEPTADQVNDGVSSVIVGSNDWAGAWAVDSSGRPLHAAVPGGEPQREFAYRFGVNLVMYALTGNYKNDQVHVPAILERLGQ
ncbi:MAG TPA: DUF4159 domain-containing protein [Stellaceae bacterium]|nr:DUF4159 domain-containing protein [Stellaceae bacterium]